MPDPKSLMVFLTEPSNTELRGYLVYNMDELKPRTLVRAIAYLPSDVVLFIKTKRTVNYTTSLLKSFRRSKDVGSHVVDYGGSSLIACRILPFLGATEKPGC